MPDQSDNLPLPGAHGKYRRLPGPDPHSPDPISDDSPPSVTSTSTTSQALIPDISNALDLVSGARQRMTGDASQKPLGYDRRNVEGQTRGKRLRLRLTHDRELASEQENMVLKKVKPEKLQEDVDRPKSKCTDKHLELAAQGEVIDSLRIVNQDSQIRITYLEKKVAKLERALDEGGQNVWPKEGWFGGSTRSQDAAKAYKLRIQELEQELRACRHEMACKDEEYATARKEHSQEMEHKENEFTKARIEFSQEMLKASALSTRVNFKISDDEARGKWQELVFKVRQFVNCYYTLSSDVPDETLGRWGAYCARPKAFLSHPLLITSLFEANVWHCLEEIVLQHSSEAWAGKLGNAYANACSVIQASAEANPEALKEYHDWRSRSVDFINRLSPSNESRLKSFTIRMANSLLWGQPVASQEAIESDMMDILLEAATLDLILRKSKAEFKVHFNHIEVRRQDRCEFNPTWMQPRDILGAHGRDESSGSRFVDLIVSPVLTKRGNSNGDKYDQQKIIVKADVVCNVLEALKDQENDNASSCKSRSIRVKNERGGEDLILPSVESDVKMEDAFPGLTSPATVPIKAEVEKEEKAKK